jgi:hypothetical protein
MASPTPFQLRAAALNQRYGLSTPLPTPTPPKAVHNRVWVAARTISTRFNTQLFIYVFLENAIYGSKGFTHAARPPKNSTVGDEYQQAITFALASLPRDQKTALYTDLPVLNDLTDFQDLEVIPCTRQDNRATAYLENFIRDSSPYR